MSGTRAGALKALATNKKKHGSNYMATIGSKGGKKTQSIHPELANFRNKEFAKKMAQKPRKEK